MKAKLQATNLASEIGMDEGATLKNMAAWYAQEQYHRLFQLVEDIHTQLGKV